MNKKSRKAMKRLMINYYLLKEVFELESCDVPLDAQFHLDLIECDFLEIVDRSKKLQKTLGKSAMWAAIQTKLEMTP